jgi:hypothetical protein
MVGWPGDQAEGGARRRLLGGGHWSSCSGAQAARPGQQVGGQALVVRGEGLGVHRRQQTRAEQ